MYSFLLQAKNGMAVDKPTDNFTGNVASQDFSGPSRVPQVFALLICLICIFVIISILRKKAKAKKDENKIKKNDTKEGD